MLKASIYFIFCTISVFYYFCTCFFFLKILFKFVGTITELTLIRRLI